MTAGSALNCGGELPSNAATPVSGMHVQVPHAADARLLEVRIDIETRDANQPAIARGTEQRLAGTCERVVAGLESGHQAIEHPKAFSPGRIAQLWHAWGQFCQGRYVCAHNTGITGCCTDV
jgi:hypothetical protein